MKRTFWAVAGYTAGLGTSLYVQKRVKKTVERVAPEQVRADVADRSRRAAGKARDAMVDIRDAANEGLTAMRAEKADLLAEFAGDEVGSADHAAINDKSASDSGAKGKGDEVIESTSGSALPFGVGHAIGVIFHGDGEINALAEFFLEENTLPSFDVGQVVDHAGGEVDKAGHSDADGFDFGVTGAEFFDEPGNLLDQGCGLFEFLGVDPGGFLNDIATVKDSGFHRSYAKIDSNSKRDVTHYRKIRGSERKGKRLFLKIVISLSNQANSMEC